MSVQVTIRPARPEDVELIFGWIVELADYERARDDVAGTPELLRAALFGPAPTAEAVIAETVAAEAAPAETVAAETVPAETVPAETVPAETVPAEGVHAEPHEPRDAPGEPAGFALFYRTFSTWECRPGIWLEDLYVPPRHRRAGVGGALLAHLAQLTLERRYTRLEWAALDWNEPALNFYKKIGAQLLAPWRLHRLDGAALARVAGEPGSNR